MGKRKITTSQEWEQHIKNFLASGKSYQASGLGR